MGQWTIKANMTAASNFTDANFDQTATTTREVIKFNGLTAGGRFRFPSSFQNFNAVTLKRVVLNLADATDWSVLLRVKDAADAANDVLLFQRSDFGSNIVSMSGDLVNLFLVQGDHLLLTTTAATGAMYAEMTIQG